MTINNYKIELATFNDCKEISRLKRQVWEETYRGIYPDSKIDNYDFAANEEKFKSIIENNDINLYVVLDGNKIIAYMSEGKPVRPFENYSQEIGLLYILQKYHKQGIGTNLFNLAKQNIKARGYKNFIISCNKYNFNAQKFYTKMGGKIIKIDEDNEDKSLPQIKFEYTNKK